MKKKSKLKLELMEKKGEGRGQWDTLHRCTWDRVRDFGDTNPTISHGPLSGSHLPNESMHMTCPSMWAPFPFAPTFQMNLFHNNNPIYSLFTI